MSSTTVTDAVPAARPAEPAPQVISYEGTAYAVLFAIAFAHFLNDLQQLLVPALYPIIKTNLGLTFSQIGLAQMTFQLTSSMLQPVVGSLTDRHPQPYSLALGMGFTLTGIGLLAFATTFPAVLLSVFLLGLGSAVFHPEASRIARMASGGRYGFAQSLFQVGGNCGTAAGPLFAAFFIVAHGQRSVVWFCFASLIAITVLVWIGRWYGVRLAAAKSAPARQRPARAVELTSRQVRGAIAILLLLIISKFFYSACFQSYYVFYLTDHFGVSLKNAQLLLFLFLASVAVGTFSGGPIGDRFGRRYVIWWSVIAVLPLTLAFPFVGLTGAVLLSLPIGAMLGSTFPAILVYAQELLPGRVGTISGLFFGFAFGMGAIGAAMFGSLADSFGVAAIFKIASLLPAIGFIAVFLPKGIGRSSVTAR